MKNKKNQKFYSFLKFFALFLTFFILGVVFSSNIKQFYVKNIVKKINLNKNTSIFSKNDLELKKFWEVYNLVKKNYYNESQVKKQDLVDGAIAGMIDAIGDKHSEFMNSEETEKFNSVLAGDFEGIGAVVEKTGIGVKVDRLIKGSPAKKAGIKKDDILVEANGKNLVGISLFDAVNLIKGPAGTDVKLKIVRIGNKEILNIIVKRDKIKIPSVETKSMTGSYNNIGYIAVNMFGETTADEFEKKLNNLKNKDGVIIDLRDNGGGYLQSAVQILSNFIENGETLVETRYKNKLKNNKYISINYDSEPYKGKVVVLLNQNSASASEITALTLKEYQKTIIVGRKSYGKGSVQEPFSLDDGSLLKLTIAKWYSPKGKNIDKKGIQPDLKVKFLEEDYKKIFDRQLDVAKKVLKDFIDLDDIETVIKKWDKLNTQRGLISSGTTLSGSLNK